VATAVENYIRYDKAKNKHPATHWHEKNSSVPTIATVNQTVTNESQDTHTN
jgi:hypothetical protein